jgi:hypothetical protein
MELHVVTCIANPVLWRSRIELYKEFEEHMLQSGVKLTTVECAYGEREWELPHNSHVNHVKVRASGRNMTWNKESLLNIGISRIPQAGYVGTFDADIRFRDPNWAKATLDALQHHHVIQPWTACYDLGPNNEHLATHKSFGALVRHQKPIVQGPNAVGGYEFGHPGYAWAWTRQALEWTGGLIESAALGAADHHMALAILGRVEETIHGGMTQAYKDVLNVWQSRAVSHMKNSISALAGTIEHGWHGNKAKRAYVSRWDILAQHKFNPLTDLKRNTYGVLELAGNKPELSRDIYAYFTSRDEDSNSLG